MIWSLFSVTFLAFAYADWGRWGDSDNGISICTEERSQSLPRIIPDYNDGAIIVWGDNRVNFINCQGEIYAQRVSSNGTVIWDSNGVVICSYLLDQKYPNMVTDNNHGAIIAWLDERSANRKIYIQRINSTGTTQWTDNGVNIGADKVYDNRLAFDMIPYGNGECIITWCQDADSLYDIYAQRIGSDSTQQWDSCGVVICNAAGNQLYPRIISDGNSGAIIIWLDERDTANNTDIYAQKINSNGTIQWDTNGVAVCSDTFTQKEIKAVSDCAGGAYILWLDDREGNRDNLWA